MRATTELFTVNGKPMLTPDGEVEVSYEDLDASDAGRDEAGFMHRIPVRRKVASWQISYQWITEEEKQYMEALFGEDATFTFGHPDRVDAGVQVQTECYRSKYSITWRSARTGLWSGYGFTVIEC